MSINKIIMIVLAIFFVIGAVDRCLGGRTQLSKEFERGFSLMGPTALTVVGLMCIAPVVAKLIAPVVVPLYQFIGADAAMFSATFFAPDSGGYAIAAELSDDPRLASFGGLIVGATIGGVISFTIPVAYGLIDRTDRSLFAVGILSGFIFDPVACFVGGLALHIPLISLLHNLLPVLISALLVVVGLYFIPTIVMQVFRVFAYVLLAIITVGLIFAALQQMTGFVVIPGMRPIADAFNLLGIVILVLAAALPMLYCLRRLLKRPLAFVGRKMGIGELAAASMIIALTSIIPVYTEFHKMEDRGKVVVAAFTASTANVFGAHLGFASATDPSVIGALIVCKFVAGAFAIPTALFFYRRMFGKK